MTNLRVSFASVSLVLSAGWCDITEDLPTGTPHTLAKDPDGKGALQFSVARYVSGERPSVTEAVLRHMLQKFADSNRLEPPRNVTCHTSEEIVVLSADFSMDESFMRAWYVTDRSNVAFVTYVVHEGEIALFEGELLEADAIARSVDFRDVV